MTCDCQPFETLFRYFFMIVKATFCCLETQMKGENVIFAPLFFRTIVGYLLFFQLFCLLLKYIVTSVFAIQDLLCNIYFFVCCVMVYSFYIILSSLKAAPVELHSGARQTLIQTPSYLTPMC